MARIRNRDRKGKTEDEQRQEDERRARGEQPNRDQAGEPGPEPDELDDGQDIEGTAQPEGWQPGNPPPLQAPDERAFTPSGSGGPGELSDEEEQRKMVKYHMEEKPWMREQMQKDHERDSRQFEENAMRQDAEAIERERDQADQNQAGEPEYDAGSAIERAQAQAAQRDGREAPTQRQEQPQDTRDQEQGHDAGAAIERAQAQAAERDRNRPIESDRDMDID